jgi:hypothetical protein
MTTSALSAALVAKGTVTVALTKPHDPAAFYRTRAGLYVNSDFRKRILRQAKPTQSASPVTLRHFELGRDIIDKDIEAELGANHEFTETEVCWIIAEMIGKQEGGAAGDLDNTGLFNLFYTPSGVVSVYWHVGTWRVPAWLVLAWLRDGLDWRADRSVFSRS